MKVLVHFDSQGEKALGIWWVDENVEGALRNLYLDPESPSTTRGRSIVYSKADPEFTWEAWFDLLSDRPPYFEVWATYDSMGMSPDLLLEALRPTPPLAV